MFGGLQRPGDQRIHQTTARLGSVPGAPSPSTCELVGTGSWLYPPTIEPLGCSTDFTRSLWCTSSGGGVDGALQRCGGQGSGVAPEVWHSCGGHSRSQGGQPEFSSLDDVDVPRQPPTDCCRFRVVPRPVRIRYDRAAARLVVAQGGCLASTDECALLTQPAGSIGELRDDVLCADSQKCSRFCKCAASGDGSLTCCCEVLSHQHPSCEVP